MKSRLLLPYGLKLLGWLLALPGFVLGYLVVYKAYEIPGFGLKLREANNLFLPAFENFTNELALILVVAGLILIAFSKQKIEDELTASIRLNALYWAILVNYAWYGLFIILASLNNVVHIIGVRAWVDFMSNDLNFLMYNLFTPLAIFIARFYYLIYKSQEEYDIKPIKLLPNKFYRPVGELLTAALIVMIIIYRIFVSEDTSDTLFLMLPMAMLVLVFSKEKQEDEYINAIRLDAMQIAVYANYIILLLANFVFYGTDFLLIMVLNLATIPTIFLIVFHYRLYRIKQQENPAGRSNLNLNIL
jgi:hypothetical protein